MPESPVSPPKQGNQSASTCNAASVRHTSGFVSFSSNCFGALLQTIPHNAAEISDSDLRDGQVFWVSVDSPWLHRVERDALASELDVIRKMAPKMVLSSHLPPAPGHMTERLLASLTATPGARPFVGPNQAALEQMLQAMTAALQIGTQLHKEKHHD